MTLRLLRLLPDLLLQGDMSGKHPADHKSERHKRQRGAFVLFLMRNAVKEVSNQEQKTPVTR